MHIPFLQEVAQTAATSAPSTAASTPQATTGSGFQIPPLAPEALWRVGPNGMLGITNTILYTYLVIVVLIVLAVLCTRKLKVVPEKRSWQTFAEVVIGAVLNVAEGAVGREKARLIFPLMGTLFVFIITANWFSLFPLIGPIYANIDGERVSLFRAVNADWSTTLAMALVTFAVTEFWALRFRAKAHIKHFLWPPGIGQIELVSEFVRILSLSVRLFGNLFAGEVLITVMTNLIPVLVPAVFLVLETLFGLIQAMVFAILCLVYFGLGAMSHGGHEDEAHDPVHATAN